MTLIIFTVLADQTQILGSSVEKVYKLHSFYNILTAGIHKVCIHISIVALVYYTRNRL